VAPPNQTMDARDTVFEITSGQSWCLGVGVSHLRTHTSAAINDPRRWQWLNKSTRETFGLFT